MKIKGKNLMYKGFVLYFFDIVHFEARLKGLDKIASTIVLSETNERFELDKPAFYLEGKPIWILIRGLPFSLEFEDFDSKKMKDLTIKIPSASEIEIKAKSLYTKMIFGKKMYDSSIYLITMLICVLVGLIVHLIDRIYFENKINEILNPTNNTISTNQTIATFIRGCLFLWV